MWSYDTAGDKWTLIQHTKPTKISATHNSYTFPPGTASCAPTRSYQLTSTWPAAANEDDVVVMVDAGNGTPAKKSNVTYACRMDVSTSTGGSATGAVGGTVAYRNQPFSWDEAAKPDAKAMLGKIEGLKPNVWTHMPTPVGCIRRAWGTSPYDSERRQFLNWGGGHSTYMGTDVNHYSLRSGLWSQSYTPGITINFVRGFLGPGLVTFRNRPFIPTHAWQCYAYDRTSDLMVVCCLKHTFTYDVRRREWVGRPFRPPFGVKATSVSLETTPKGLIVWANKGLFLFDGKKRAWKKLPLSGKLPGTPYAEVSGMCYDSKRDCLWLGYSSASISKYDIKSGVLSKFTGAPAVLKDKKGHTPYLREMTFVADQDLVLLLHCNTKDGKSANHCFDPKDGKWYWLKIPYMTAKGETSVVGKLPRNRGYYGVTTAMNYDPKHKVVLLNHGRIWLLKLDRTTAKMEEIK